MQSIAHWYQANYFRQPYEELTGFPQVEMPVLQIHGLADPAVTKEGLADTWDWVDGEYTLELYVDGQLVQQSTAAIGTGAPPPTPAPPAEGL